MAIEDIGGFWLQRTFSYIILFIKEFTSQHKDKYVSVFFNIHRKMISRVVYLVFTIGRPLRYS